MVDYQTMTNLRVRLVNPFDNLGVNDSYVYYAIYEWSIQGTCLCNGHGECSPLEGEELVDGKVSHLVGACAYNMHAKGGICSHVSEHLDMSLNTSLVYIVYSLKTVSVNEVYVNSKSGIGVGMEVLPMHPMSVLILISGSFWFLLS